MLDVAVIIGRPCNEAGEAEGKIERERNAASSPITLLSKERCIYRMDSDVLGLTLCSGKC